jgi:hypothetical protein
VRRGRDRHPGAGRGRCPRGPQRGGRERLGARRLPAPPPRGQGGRRSTARTRAGRDHGANIRHLARAHAGPGAPSAARALGGGSPLDRSDVGSVPGLAGGAAGGGADPAPYHVSSRLSAAVDGPVVRHPARAPPPRAAGQPGHPERRLAGSGDGGAARLPHPRQSRGQSVFPGGARARGERSRRRARCPRGARHGSRRLDGPHRSACRGAQARLADGLGVGAGILVAAPSRRRGRGAGPRPGTRAGRAGAARVPLRAHRGRRAGLRVQARAHPGRGAGHPVGAPAPRAAPARGGRATGPGAETRARARPRPRLPLRGGGGVGGRRPSRARGRGSRPASLCQRGGSAPLRPGAQRRHARGRGRRRHRRPAGGTGGSAASRRLRPRPRRRKAAVARAEARGGTVARGRLLGADALGRSSRL